jgi:hypothetical protein
MKGRWKIGLFQEWVPVRGGCSQDRGYDSEYGRCILCPYMKIEE